MVRATLHFTKMVANVPSALFLLYIQFAAPSGTFDDDTFHAVKAAEERETKFNWPKISWIFVFQYPIVEFLCIVVQEATQATGDYCLDSLNPKYAHLWVEVIESVSISFCVISILKFYGHMKRLMKARRGLSKLAAFKIIVFIRFAQQWVFSTLLEYHLMKPSSKLSYNDILYGIPATASCVEMALFSFGFWYAFSASEYSSKAKPHERPLPLWKAALDALNPMDLILGLGRIFPLCFEMRRTGDWKEWRVAQRESGVQGATRKAIRKYKNKRQSGAEQGRSQVPGVGMESLSKPAEMHYAHSESDTSYRANPTTGGISGADMYQPPEGSPPGYASEYLTTEQVPYGRPRATSSSSLMAETQPQSSRATSPYAGQWNGQRYEVPETHSPRQSFVEEPTQGRDIV